MISANEIGDFSIEHHQRAIKKVVFGLEKLFQKGIIKLEPLPKTDIDPGNPESKCPDIILQDPEGAAVPIIIEIATNRGWRTDFKKLKNLIDETEYGIEEGFVLNFEKMKWHKYSKQNGIIENNPSWSNILDVDLAKML